MRIFANTVKLLAAAWVAGAAIIGQSTAMPLASHGKAPAPPAVTEQAAGYLPGLTELEDDDLDPAGKAPDDASTVETMSPGKGKSIMIEILKHT